MSQGDRETRGQVKCLIRRQFFRERRGDRSDVSAADSFSGKEAMVISPFLTSLSLDSPEMSYILVNDPPIIYNYV